MSESIRHSEHETSDRISATLLDRVGVQEEARSLLRRQLPVIRQMIGDLDDHTGAGRRYTMEKVVEFFRHQIGCGVLAAGRRNSGMLSHHVDQLAGLSQQLMPDVCAFSDRAETLLSLLSATVQ